MYFLSGEFPTSHGSFLFQWGPDSKLRKDSHVGASLLRVNDFPQVPTKVLGTFHDKLKYLGGVDVVVVVAAAAAAGGWGTVVFFYLM